LFRAFKKALFRGQSGTGVPHSKTLARLTGALEILPKKRTDSEKGPVFWAFWQENKGWERIKKHFILHFFTF
jgi:hypothetical protein